MKTDVNTWRILRRGDEGISKGIVLTYVDDIMVIAEEALNDEVMKEIDGMWKCSPEEVVKKGGPTVSF